MKSKIKDELTEKTFVKVRMLRTSWMFKGGRGEEHNNLLDLMESISKSEASDESVYTNEFLHTIVEAFWLIYQKSIVKFIVIPFSIYVILCLIFLPHLMYEREDRFWNIIWLEWTVKLVLVLLALYLFSFDFF